MKTEIKAKEYTLGRLEKFMQRFGTTLIRPADIVDALAKEIEDAYLTGYSNGQADATRKETPDSPVYDQRVN